MASRRAPGHRGRLTPPTGCVALVFLVGTLPCLGCEPEPSTGTPVTATVRAAGKIVGPDCAALAAAATRAAPCDPALGALAASLRADPDERRCRGAARRLIEGERAPRVASLHEPGWPDLDSPLRPEERAALTDFPLPAHLELQPDLAPAPGRPATAARLDGRPIASEDDGRLSTHTPPGRFLLAVAHADDQREYCVTLDACQELSLVAHGAQLAPNPALRPGPCEPPSETP